ncbi:hypothetical protein LSAT2_002551 [Lamellibrachia satsuma]|nr:hypothetical protein LSAT2_002551 [Lamellibrachia satsuma]
MPQCVSRKNTDAPCGKGTRATELMECTLRMRQRTAQINKTEHIRLKSYTDMIEKRRRAEEARKLRLIQRTRRTLEEIRAYQKVLPAYSARHLLSLQCGNKASEDASHHHARRFQLENRILNVGFGIETLRQQIQQTIESSRPEVRARNMRKRMLCIAKKRSDFLIDRKVTNEALKHERLLVASVPINDDLSAEIQSMSV